MTRPDEDALAVGSPYLKALGRQRRLVRDAVATFTAWLLAAVVAAAAMALIPVLAIPAGAILIAALGFMIKALCFDAPLAAWATWRRLPVRKLSDDALNARLASCEQEWRRMDVQRQGVPALSREWDRLWRARERVGLIIVALHDERTRRGLPPN